MINEHGASVFKVIMQWAEGKKIWQMLNANTEKFVYDFWDCENFHKAFPGVDKSKPKKYSVMIKEIEE